MAACSLSDFDYCLPKELIAQYPLKERSCSRLLVLRRRQRELCHRHFADITGYFLPGDVLVLNNTKVIWARLIGRRAFSSCGGGGKQELFLLRRLDDYKCSA